MNLCGTCKWWGKGAYGPFGNEEDDDGNELSQSGPWRSCGRIPHTHYQNEPEDVAPENRRAVTCDGSDFFSAIKTAEDFGCVLHERNP